MIAFFYVWIATVLICLMLGSMWGRWTVTNWLFGFPDREGVSGPHCVDWKFYYVVPESLWTETAIRRRAVSPVNDKPFVAPSTCIRPEGHDGPCNGLPCLAAIERMEGPVNTPLGVPVGFASQGIRQRSSGPVLFLPHVPITFPYSSTSFLPVDKSAVRDIVNREIEPLMERLGIRHWEITTSYVPSIADDDGRLKRGYCTRLIDYNSAHIEMNPETFDDEKQVLSTLRHELFHIVLAPYDLAWTLVQRMLKDDPTKLEVVDAVWTHAMEKTVINLSRMHHGLTTEKAPAKACDCQERQKIADDYDVMESAGKAASAKGIERFNESVYGTGVRP